MTTVPRQRFDSLSEALDELHGSVHRWTALFNRGELGTKTTMEILETCTRVAQSWSLMNTSDSTD